MSKKVFKCKYGCQTDVRWPDNYQPGERPVELNGDAHNCPNYPNQNGSPTMQTFEGTKPQIEVTQEGNIIEINIRLTIDMVRK